MKSTKRRIVIAVFLTVLLCCTWFCAACRPSGVWLGFISESYFHTNATLRLYAEREEDVVSAEQLTESVRNTLKHVEEKIGISVACSDVNRFNEAETGERIEICETAYRVFSEAKRIYEWTDGAYNPAVYYSVLEYGFYFSDRNKPPTLPDLERIDAFRRLSEHFSDIVLECEDGKFYVTKPQDAFITIGEERLTLKVDLGGIGKGYAADCASKLIEEAGFSYGYFNFSASSMSLKKYLPDREQFVLSVADPREEGEYISIGVCDTALSTSGDNGLYFERDGVRYSQIINPESGMPVNVSSDGKQTDGIISATVLGGSAVECDALTTALMAMGREKAVGFMRTHLSERKVFFVYRSNNSEFEVVTNVSESEFRLLKSGYQLTVIQ